MKICGYLSSATIISQKFIVVFVALLLVSSTYRCFGYVGGRIPTWQTLLYCLLVLLDEAYLVDKTYAQWALRTSLEIWFKDEQLQPVRLTPVIYN